MRKLPDFFEFANSITEEQVEQIQKDCAVDRDELKKRFKKEGYSVIPAVFEEKSFIQSLSLLSLYHKWLSEQLNKD